MNLRIISFDAPKHFLPKETLICQAIKRSLQLALASTQIWPKNDNIVRLTRAGLTR